MNNIEGIIICPIQYKNNMIKESIEQKCIFDRTFFTIEEFMKNIFYTPSKEDIYLVSKEFNISYVVSALYLKYIYTLEFKKLSNSKTDCLEKIKKYLIEKKMYIDNKFFIDILSQKAVHILGYYKTKEVDLVIDYLSAHGIFKIDFQVKSKVEHKKVEMLEFHSIKEEIEYNLIEISKLIDSGVSPNNIKICNASSEYTFYINTLKTMLTLPLNITSNKNIYATQTTKKFLEFIDENMSLDEAFIALEKEKYVNSYVISKIKDILNDLAYYKYDTLSLKEALIYNLKNTSFEKTSYENEIEVLNFTSAVIKDDTYYFILGFNNQNAYKIASCEDFYSNEELDKLGLSNSFLKTANNKQNTIDNIYLAKNLSITYASQSPFQKYTKTSLVEELGINVIKKLPDYKYNKDIYNLKLGELLDNYYNFNEESDTLKALYSLDYQYKTFDNTYKGIDKNLNSFIKPLKLSYTHLNEYYMCPFMYYLINVLRIDEFKSSIQTTIGNYVHEIMENSYKEDFSLDNFKPEDYGESSKEIFYLKKSLDYVKLLIEKNKSFETLTNFRQAETERQIDIDYENEGFSFTGKVDKILYTDDNFLMIVDYKTGSAKVSLDNLENGLNMQLPIYYYMIKKCGDYKDSQIVGFYLQYINLSVVDYSCDEDVENSIKDSYKLYGYTTNDSITLSSLSKISFSDFFAKLKLKKDGDFTASSKVIVPSSLDNMFRVVDRKIKEAAKNILNAKFEIAPKVIDGVNYGCRYCHFSDVCFKTPKDFCHIKKQKFDLGGSTK